MYVQRIQNDSPVFIKMMEQRAQSERHTDKLQNDSSLFRKTMGHFASGVTIITTVYEGIVHGMTANSFCSVSLEPPQVLVAVNNHSHMHACLAQSGFYGISILARDQELLSRHFSGRTQKHLQVPFVWYEGCPLIEGSLAQLICKVVHAHPAGDHTLFMGQVESLGYANNCAPLLIYAGKYQALEVQIPDNTLLYEPSWW